ncbi:MAG: hypothetical protein AB7I25_02710 [Vicinamibacterales bacterium]
MTAQQLHVFNAGYLAVFVVAALLTRAPWRRVAGAAAGGMAGGAAALGIIAAGEATGWWHMALGHEPSFVALFLLDFALSGFIFLGTWRIARRFGWQGLAAVAAVAAVLGPVRDYAYMSWFPEWGEYADGAAPVLAVSATYLALGVVGHAVMRLVSGPAGTDQLARRRF